MPLPALESRSIRSVLPAWTVPASACPNPTRSTCAGCRTSTSFEGAASPARTISGMLRLFSRARLIEHVRSEADLLEMAVRGERVSDSVPLHNHEREAICQAPVLVGAAPVQLHRGGAEAGLKRDHVDSPIGVNSPIVLYTNMPINAAMGNCPGRCRQ